jgi:hypothetical protein
LSSQRKKEISRNSPDPEFSNDISLWKNRNLGILFFEYGCSNKQLPYTKIASVTRKSLNGTTAPFLVLEILCKDFLQVELVFPTESTASEICILVQQFSKPGYPSATYLLCNRSSCP